MHSNPAPVSAPTQNEPGARPQRIQVVRTNPDINHPEFTTLQHLGYDGTTPPGSLQRTLEAVFPLLRSQHKQGTRFANPCALVTATTPSTEFIAAARREQHRWWSWLNEAFYSSTRVKRMIRHMDSISRQLHFTGVMIINGKHVRPNQWPDSRDSPQETSPVGQVFGRLTVKSELQGGFCHCQCHCGKTTDVHRKHLRSGGTSSCGCLRAEYDQRLQDKKLTRAWLHS